MFKVGEYLIHKTFQTPKIIRLEEKVVLPYEPRSPNGFRYKIISTNREVPDAAATCFVLTQFYRRMTPAEKVLWLKSEK